MRILIFGGTTEGRRLADRLLANGMDVTLSVATDYGKEAAPANPALTVLARRMDEDEMTALLRKSRFDCVVDATHPYAKNATVNIKAACAAANAEYLRLTRDKGGGGQSVIYAADAADAAELLKNVKGNVLLAVGSKELGAFTAVEGYSDRMFVRILPMPDSLEKALRLGFRNANIICMQGPFDVEMNVATLKMTEAAFMVTKDSGEAGGFSQKCIAAERVGCKVIVISRPEEDGCDFNTVLRHLNIESETEKRQFTYFPLFTNICDRKITVIGGGKVAERRVRTLLSYGAALTVISPKLSDSLNELAQSGAIRHERRAFQSGDASDAFLVIAATNSREVNYAVKAEANEHGALAIVSDNRNECDCCFPAIAENDVYVCGMVSKNGNHSGVAALAENFRRLLSNEKNC